MTALAVCLLAGLLGALGWRYLALLEAREAREEEREGRRALTEDGIQRRLAAVEVEVARLSNGLEEARARLAWRNGG